MDTLYNKHGEAVAYINDDREHIYLYDGSPVGYLKKEYLYNYSGRYLGWINNGWFYDRQGKTTFFTSDSTGGPTRPTRKTRPTRSTRRTRPTKSTRETRPTRPTLSLSWSQFTGSDYFIQ
tara:strand:+ start:2067 stop:2426 length:360 start_codon:yes stop_codon:yes gene_type:complete